MPVTTAKIPLISNGSDKDVQHLKSEVEYRTKLQEICNKIYAAANLDEILIDLKDEITKLFVAERITIYVVDGKKRELVSRFKSGIEISEIRIPVNNNSIAGSSANKQKLINIKDVYDENELKSIDQDLKFDKSWDQKTGYTTKQVLVYPIIFKKFMLGAIQLINRTTGTSFIQIDEWAVEELAKILGIALYNQKKMAAKSKPSKFDYLLEHHILSQKELQQAISSARSSKESIEQILMKEMKVSKKDIGKSLGQFYKVPYTEFNNHAPIPGELLAGLKVPFMRQNIWVPMRREENKILIAVDDPHDLQKIDMLKQLFAGRPLTFTVCLREDILEYIKLFTQDEKELASMDEILSQLRDEDSAVEEAESGVGDEDSAVVQLVNKIILDANARGASDIHIEPYPGKANTQVRIRIDGSCSIYQTIPFAYKNAVVSRIKIMADLDIAERRKPQDGKIKDRKSVV